MRKLLFVALLGAAFLCGAVQNGVSNAETPYLQYPKFPKAQLDSVVHITTVWASPDSEKPVKFSGSGVAVSPTRILTAKHLVQDEGEGLELVGIEVTIYGLPNGGRVNVDGKLVREDPNFDLAIIDVDSPLLRPANLDMACSVEAGDPVFCVGGPSGLTAQYISFGYISNVGDEPLLSDKSYFGASNAVWGGNSGGPLFNANTMQVVGILVAGTRAPNVALFVPLTLAKDILK